MSCNHLPEVTVRPPYELVDPFPEITDRDFFTHSKYGKVAKLPNGALFQRQKDGWTIYAPDFDIHKYIRENCL